MDTVQNHKQLLEELSEEVRCVICLELFQDPRLIQCSHTFCFQCISQIARGGQIVCPICRDIHKLDRKGVDGLAKNRYISNIVEKLQKTESIMAQVSSPMLSQPEGALPFPYNLYAAQSPINPAYSTVNQPDLSNSAYPALHNPYPMAPSVTPSAPPAIPSAPPMMEEEDSPMYEAYPPIEYGRPQTNNDSQHNAPIHSDRPVSPPSQHAQPTVASATDSMSSGKEEDTYTGSAITSIFTGLFNFFKPSAGDKREGSLEEGPFYAPFDVKSVKINPLFTQWTHSLWFAPADYVDSLKIVREEALYVPFWSFDVVLESHYTAVINSYEPNTRKKITRESKVEGTLRKTYNAIIVCADVDLERDNEKAFDLVGTISDWRTTKCRSNVPESCTESGVLTSLFGQSRSADPFAHSMIVKSDRAKDSDQAFQQKLPSLQQWVEEDCRTKMYNDTVCESISDFEQRIHFLSIVKTKLYLPVYLLKYAYQGNEYTAIINAQTGTLQGERPYGMGRLGSIGRSGFEFMESVLFGKKRKETIQHIIMSRAFFPDSSSRSSYESSMNPLLNSQPPLLPLLSEDSTIPFIVNFQPKRKSSKAQSLLRDILTEQESEVVSAAQVICHLNIFGHFESQLHDEIPTSFEIIRQFKLTTGRMGSVMSLLVAEKQRKIYCGTMDRRIRMWNISSGEVEGEFEGHIGYASSLAIYHPSMPEREGDEAAPGFLFSGGSEGTIRSWNTQTFQCDRIFKGHASHINIIRLSEVFPSLIQLFSASSDGTLKMWNALTAELLQNIVIGESIYSLEIHSIPRTVHVLAAGRTLRCYTISEPDITVMQPLSTCVGHTDAIWSLMFFIIPQAAGHFAFSGCWDRTVRLWNLHTGQCVQKYEGHMHHVYCMTTNYASGSVNKSRWRKSSVTDDDGVHFSPPDDDDEAAFPDFIPDMLFTGAADGLAIAWDIMDGKQLIRFEGHKGTIEKLQFDGNFLYTASSDKTIRIWNHKTGKCLTIYNGHTSFVEHLKLVPGAIISGANDGTIILWAAYRPQQARLSRGDSFFDFISTLKEETQSSNGSPRRMSMSIHEDLNSEEILQSKRMPSKENSLADMKFGTIPRKTRSAPLSPTQPERNFDLRTKIGEILSKLNETMTSPTRPEPPARTNGRIDVRSISVESAMSVNPLFGRHDDVTKLNISSGRFAAARTLDPKHRPQQRGLSAFFFHKPKTPTYQTRTSSMASMQSAPTSPLSHRRSAPSPIDPIEISLSEPDVHHRSAHPSSAPVTPSEDRDSEDGSEDRLLTLMEKLENGIKGEALLIQKLQRMVQESIRQETEDTREIPNNMLRSKKTSMSADASFRSPRRMTVGSAGASSRDFNSQESFRTLGMNSKSRSFPDMSKRMTFADSEWLEAAQRGDFKSLKHYLVYNSPDVNSKDEKGMTALHWVCKRRDHLSLIEIVKRAKGLKINARDSLGNTPIHYAAQQNDVEIIILLLSLPSIDARISNEKRQKPIDLTTSKSITTLLKHATKTLKQMKNTNFGSVRVTTNPLMRRTKVRDKMYLQSPPPT
ncbi:hypothetical protein PROFUN_06386 [Planoprotostelium fungivorum]|uniref:RING-type domain-containing protein n=1 Tax=Planoprotostelium fungivorum TaxID=1890364 RepID=A0A2P6NNQ9_9EUKA|nr:hypothetical protein PROFUN_06386 [Planoprotostelium fungivorum]